MSMWRIGTVTCAIAVLAPLPAGAGGKDLFEIQVQAEALQRNADVALRDVSGRHARRARRLAARALSAAAAANTACPTRPRRAAVKLLGAGARWLRFSAALEILPQSEVIAALQEQAHGAARDTLDLHFGSAICDSGLTLQAGSEEDTAIVSAPSEVGSVTPFGEFEFVRATEFVNFGAVWGSQFETAHGTLGIFGGGQPSPPHTHRSTYYAVVLSGVLSNPFGIEPEPPSLRAGSFWSVPAGEQHLTVCVSLQPCLFYFHSREAFDFAVLDGPVTDPRSPLAQSVSVQDLEFESISPFAEFSTVWGDRGSAAHGTIARFQAGAASPAHTHSVAYHGVVVSGTLVNPFGDQSDPPTLTTGSYWFVPAGVPHVTACVSEEPCLFYFHAEDSFDFIATGE